MMRTIILVVALLWPFQSSALAMDQVIRTSSAEPWRVIYVEGGPWPDFYLSLAGLARGLAELGIIENFESRAADQGRTEALWRHLAEKAGGGRLRFLADGFYSAGWDPEDRIRIKASVLRRLERGEVDLVLAFGTWAGQDLVTAEHQIPVLSITATDPVGAGICPSAEDSGLDHAHVQVETGRSERQLLMFQEVFGFQSLGVPVDVTADGQKTIGWPAIEAAADRLGLDLIPCPAELETPDPDYNTANLITCLEKLGRHSQAVFLTLNQGMRPEKMEEIMVPIIAAGLPSFSQLGPSEVRAGVLMSLAEDDFSASGRWVAEVLRRILEGARPRDLSQIYQGPLTMSLNLDSARAIGWEPDFELLATVDEIQVGPVGRPSEWPQ